MTARNQRMKRTVLWLALGIAFSMKILGGFISFPSRFFNFVAKPSALHFFFRKQAKVMCQAFKVGMMAFRCLGTRP